MTKGLDFQMVNLKKSVLKHVVNVSMFLTLAMKEGGNVKFGGNQSGKIIGT